MKFNCFFLMPVIDVFPMKLREELEVAYDADLDAVFDIQAVRPHSLLLPSLPAHESVARPVVVLSHITSSLSTCSCCAVPCCVPQPSYTRNGTMEQQGLHTKSARQLKASACTLMAQLQHHESVSQHL